MEIKTILCSMSGAFIAVGSIFFAYQLYNMIVTDAKARGFKHPGFWGFFALGNNNGGGLILYLIGRRNHPILHMSDEIRQGLEKRKKAAGVGLAFLCIGTIGLIICVMLM